MPSFSRFFGFGVLALCTALPAAAAPQSNVPEVVKNMLACKSMAADAERLACYDKASAAFDQAVAEREVTIVDKQEVSRTRRSLFGYMLPNLAVLGIGDKDDQKASEFTTLDSTIKSVRGSSYGKWEMELEEQAVWRNVELLDAAPKTGEKVHIRKASLGSYFMKIGDRRSVRAVRIR
jgi:hypothetical protein